MNKPTERDWVKEELWPNCTCPRGWQSLGALYGIRMGYGWVRLSDAPDCPDHGKDKT